MTTPLGGTGGTRVHTIEQIRYIRAVGQVAPGATTATTLYTVPLKRMARGRVYVCERGGAAATFRVSIREDGDALANKHYIAYDEPLPANRSDYTEELLLDETDIVEVYASSANLSFTFLGELEPKDTA